MLKCNLAVLLAERKIRISKASSDTGISRTTLTSLANNYSQGIQLETLNKLCLYLQCPPEKFFAYLPFDYSLYISPQSQGVFTADITFSSKGKTSKACFLVYSDDSGVDIELFDDDPEGNAVLKKYLAGMPAIFKRDIEEKILASIGDSAPVSWPEELA